jgi:CheY-like chemotaxis protein
MPKILLVEDDNNLREIFEMRLQADGYQTVTAGDGEEALVVAMKEKPDLIIADVMMPRLSGFEMLETMRAAPELKDTRVIMMTALGQAEDRARGNKLGVVEYLVKSQVTLEDFVRVVREVLKPDAGPQPAPGQANQSTINKESEKSMPDDTQPTNPAADPSAGGGAPANPIGDSAGGVSSSDPQSTNQEQKDVDNQVKDWESSTPATPPADSGTGAPSMGGDSSGGGSTDVPVSSPPTDPAAPSGDQPAPGGSPTPGAPGSV